MEFVDYYETMGLDENASEGDIKRAYRKLARKYHPDVSKEPDSEAKFKELGEAYGVLKDSERRREYDELRRYRDPAGGSFTPPPGWQYQGNINPDDFQQSGFGQGHQSAEFSDFFEQIFGSKFRQSSTPHTEQHFDARGQDVHTRLSVSINDAFHGATVEVSIKLPVAHTDGSIRNEVKTLRVKVPAGVVDGQNIRLRGQGGPAIGKGGRGDLYIEISIHEDSTYHLNGRDVSVNLPIAPWEAALGASVEVSTLSGTVKLTIPPNAKQGQRLRLKGRGLPGTPPGDQYAVLNIVIPEARTEEQKAFYTSMSELWPNHPRSTSGAST